MKLDKYAGVIKLVLTRNPGKSPEELTSEILKSVEIAQAIAGEIDMPAAAVSPKSTNENVLIKTPEQPFNLRSVNLKPSPPPKAVLISVAPPVAGVSEEDTPEDDIDYYESKPGKGDGANRLQTKLQAVFPASIKVQLPGFDEPLTLVRGLSSPGIKFVHVNYTVQGSTEQGPRVTLMTSQKDIDVDKVLADITDQAGAMYSKEKRTITPRAAPPNPPPSNQELQQMLERDRKGQGNTLPVSAEDVEISKEWGSTRSPRWQ